MFLSGSEILTKCVLALDEEMLVGTYIDADENEK